MNTQKIKILLATATLAASIPHGAWAENAPAADSLPPLVDGKIPTNVDELWGNYDPAKEPLETEVVREWREGDITIRHVVFTIGRKLWKLGVGSQILTNGGIRRFRLSPAG